MTTGVSRDVGVSPASAVGILPASCCHCRRCCVEKTEEYEGGTPSALAGRMPTALVIATILTLSFLTLRADEPTTQPDATATTAASEPVSIETYLQPATAPTQPATEPSEAAGATTLPATATSEPASSTSDAAQETAELAGGYWQLIRRADADSTELKVADSALRALIASLPADHRAEAAIAMMRDSADDPANVAAMTYFCPAGLSYSSLNNLLSDNRRTPKSRALLLATYSLLRPDAGSCLGGRAREDMICALAVRLVEISGGRTDFAEQRLMVQLCQDALTAPYMLLYKALYQGMDSYTADGSDSLSAAIRGWQMLLKDPPGKIATNEQAMAALGHWDAIVRLQAAQFLATASAKDAALLEKVTAMLADPRDEARAAAATVFAMNTAISGDKVIPKMIDLLTKDPGVPMQSAAADVLVARAAVAGSAIAPLLAVFDNRLPGEHRTSAILRVLARLAEKATDQQRERMLALASVTLEQDPRGSLELFKALGAAARPALATIRAYRAQADRTDRQFIDKHVIPAIVMTSK